MNESSLLELTAQRTAVKNIYWRSKENRSPPFDAEFYLLPFRGNPTQLAPLRTISSLPSAHKKIGILERIDNPDYATWQVLVQNALRQIESGHLQKVVLARETILSLASAPDPLDVAAALEKRAMNAALFCIEFENSRSFLGATPERLFRRKGQIISTEAIAGTRKYGKTERENHRLEQELLSSEKDRREFQFVQDYLEENLRPYCECPIEFSPVQLYHTANVHHLCSKASGILLEKENDLKIAQQLHPSPALCGTPKQAAFSWIETHEPFSRGLYGGIIGWQNPAESDWMVAIRSCLLEGKTARIFTGTGIVAGSHPKTEWEELDAKLSLYEEVFCLL